MTSPSAEVIHSCYLAAAPYTVLFPIVQLLEEREISVVSEAETNVHASAASRAADLIRRADLVVCVVGTEEQANVLFEAGIAYGLGKRILFVVPPTVTLIPFDIASLNLTRASLDDRAAIGFALDQLLQSPPPVSQSSSSVAGQWQPLRDKADEFLKELRSLMKQDHQSDAGLARLVERVLVAAGARSVTKGEPAQGADLVVWDDELQAITGNPILVEVKRTLSPGAVNQVLSWLLQGRGKFGLLLYGAGPESTSPFVPRHPFVIALPILDLVESLRSRSLGRVLTEHRNRIVHAVDN